MYYKVVQLILISQYLGTSLYYKVVPIMLKFVFMFQAALRKISNVCSLEDFQSADIQQLIQPKLVDSYLICSNGDESFV